METAVDPLNEPEPFSEIEGPMPDKTTIPQAAAGPGRLKWGARVENWDDGWVVLWRGLEWREGIGEWRQAAPGGYYNTEPDAIRALNAAPPPPGYVVCSICHDTGTCRASGEDCPRCRPGPDLSGKLPHLSAMADRVSELERRVKQLEEKHNG